MDTVIAFVMHKILGFAATLPLIAMLFPITPSIAYNNHSGRGYSSPATSSLSLKFSPQAAHASSNWSRYKSSSYKKPTPTPATTTPKVPTPKPTVPVAIPTVPIPTVPIPGVGEVSLSAYITGYSYWDNTPPGSADISNGVVHSKAGGTGTYADPITLAVGHSIEGSKHTLDYEPGTKFYFPFIKKYAIVEDTCGDGSHPQDGPCHSGYQGKPWLDLYVDGKDSRSVSDDCMNSITDIHTVIKNPGPNYPVVAGLLSESGCKIF